jgi:hypothetical protein
VRNAALASGARGSYDPGMRHAVPLLLLAPLVAQATPSPAASVPQTVPEASAYERTSRLADVERFVAECTKLSHGDRLTVRTAGTSHGGRPLLLVGVAAKEPPPAPRLRALVIGNIHAGEVEGKEAAQQLLREFASGAHADVLARCEVWFLPIYNVDGNEAVGPKNRVGQNGPDLVGERANAQGLDLNRDAVKADAPETRVLLQLFRELDPHLFVDLHTTNGSAHGYHLTYSPSLSTNLDPGIARLSRALLDDATAAMAKEHRFQTFDYGNFETRDWDGGGAPESNGTRGWFSFDHRARYVVNYFGLRNRIAILSEAYSYDDFATRIAATRAFVLVLLQRLAARADEVHAAAAAADARLAAADAPVWFGHDTTFAPPETLPVLVSAIERVERGGELPMRHVRKGDATPETMPVHRAFRSRAQRALPAAWAVLAPTPATIERLQWHGIAFTTLAAVEQRQAARFRIDKQKRPKRPYQGHQELVLEGAWLPATATELPTGTLVVDARQRLGRLAAQLLEPESEDSLSSWNFFEAATAEHYPVLRLER